MSKTTSEVATSRRWLKEDDSDLKELEANDEEDEIKALCGLGESTLLLKAKAGRF